MSGPGKQKGKLTAVDELALAQLASAWPVQARNLQFVSFTYVTCLVIKYYLYN